MLFEPNIKSWIKIADKSDFPIQNIPFGIIKPKIKNPRVATRLGDFVIDIFELAKLGYLDNLDQPKSLLLSIFDKPFLNDFLALGKEFSKQLRNILFVLFESGNSALRDNQADLAEIIYAIEDVEVLMPINIGDYTDFYSSIDHATNVGKMFRNTDNALLPNWKHIPVAYHGRSSSIVVSDTNFHRPMGQLKNESDELPHFGPSKLMDFELEMGFVVCKQTKMGQRVSVANASEYISGLLIFNDLSARDIQKWEYVPLGPFLGKNFASVISPWLVTLEALEPFIVGGLKLEPEVLPYLKTKENYHFDIQLEVYIQPEGDKEYLICTSNHKYLYWNILQQLAHHTVNGCNLNVGDLCASGTISGPEPSSFGSMLELSWNGSKPIKLGNNKERKFLEDNDTIIMRGFAEKNGIRIGFGECKTKMLPALGLD